MMNTATNPQRPFLPLTLHLMYLPLPRFLLMFSTTQILHL
uniref:Uncharacterized protein n=1 Tax=Manihot esculenta TaxID=3983 RepID=A0A2C9V759_MANES